MIIRRHRNHTVQPEDYNSLSFGAHVEIDTEKDADFADMEIDEIEEELSGLLDDLLAPEVSRVLALGGNITTDHHLNDFYS